MDDGWAIGPWIGIARVGNSPNEFYLEPEEIGARPIECDQQGNAHVAGGAYARVQKFKDSVGRVKRQAARFRLFRLDPQSGQWRAPLSGEISGLTWTVHLANKKACWHNFSGLHGDRTYPNNDYQTRGVGWRNPTVTNRRQLIIDPGPRSIGSGGAPVAFDSASMPAQYTLGNFPDGVKQGDKITTLGEIRINGAHELLVLGGLGRAGGTGTIDSFAGADGWYDDISDGPVTCTFKTDAGKNMTLRAWCIVGAPKFAPEIVNIVSLADTMYDVAVRLMAADPNLYSGGAFDPQYVANYDRDIRPILERPAAYRWVVGLPGMNSISPPPFDATSSAPVDAPLRQAYFGLFRKPFAQSNELLASTATVGNFPMMPLNSGSNSLYNPPMPIDKFLTLTETQHFLLGQWASGQFSLAAAPVEPIAMQLTRASLGNCVGAPLCPGIEVCWNVRQPNIYESPLRIRHRHDEAYYCVNGLDPTLDETADALGCEPGDLTKRMASPWQADFQDCTAQPVHFTDPQTTNVSHMPAPPTYYAPWWPPQSPLQVLTGDMTADSQALAGTPGGYQVTYARGIRSAEEMVNAWHYLAFVVNQTAGPYAAMFPYLTEQERNNDRFVAMANADDPATATYTDSASYADTWFLRSVLAHRGKGSS